MTGKRDDSSFSKLNSKTDNTTIRFTRITTNTSHGFSGSHSKYKLSLGQGPGKAFRPQDTLEVFFLTTLKLLNIRGLLVKKDRSKVSQAQWQDGPWYHRHIPNRDLDNKWCYRCWNRHSWVECLPQWQEWAHTWRCCILFKIWSRWCYGPLIL